MIGIERISTFNEAKKRALDLRSARDLAILGLSNCLLGNTCTLKANSNHMLLPPD